MTLGGPMCLRVCCGRRLWEATPRPPAKQKVNKPNVEPLTKWRPRG